MEKSLAVALLCVGGDRGDSGSVFGGVDGDVCMEDRGGRIFGGVADASRGASGSGFGGVDGDIKGMGDVRMEDKDGGILDIGVVDSVGVMGGGDVSSGGVVGGVVDSGGVVGRRVGDVVDTTDASRGGVSGGVSGDVIFD